MTYRILAALAFLTVSAANGQTIERAAALEFAIRNGLEVAPGTVVAVETIADSTNPRPAPSRVEMRGTDATALAAVLGESARTASATTLIACERRSCWARGEAPVIVVGDPEITRDDRTVVLLTYYFNTTVGGVTTRHRTVAAVSVHEEAPGKWGGVSFAAAPVTVTQRPGDGGE